MEMQFDSQREFLRFLHTSDDSSKRIMRRRYRRSLVVGQTSIFRRVLLTGSWICLFFYQIHKHIAVASAFIFAVLLFPFVISWTIALQLWRLVLHFFISWRYPNYTLVATRSLRCALDTRRWPGLVVGLVLLDDTEITLTELRPRILGIMEAQMRAHSALRKRIACHYGCYLWREYNESEIPDANKHVLVWSKRANNENQLQDMVGTISSRPLPADRSPWEVVLIPFGRRWSILVRAHHLLVDGDFPFEDLLCPTSFGLWTGVAPPLLRQQSATLTAFTSLTSIYIHQWTSIATKLNEIKIIRLFSGLLNNPYEKLLWAISLIKFPSINNIIWLIEYPIILWLSSLLFLWRSFTSFFHQIFSLLSTDHPASSIINAALIEIRECFKLILMAPHVIATQLTFRSENVPLLRASVSPGYRVLAWTPPVTNRDLQRVAEAGKSSDEHVLLAAIAGALRHFLLSNGAKVPVSVPAIIPVAVGERQTRAFALVDLPTGEWDPCGRLNHIRRQLVAVEKRPLNVIVGALAMELASFVLPQPVLTMALNFLSRRHPVTICCINAPSAGCAFPVIEATRLFYWRPPQGNAGLTFTLLMGDEHVTMAVASNQHVLPKPSVITAQFSREIHAMAVALHVRLEKKTPTPPSTAK